MRLQTALVAGLVAMPALYGLRMQIPASPPADERTLREYAGVYQWESAGFIYLQLWNELAGVNQLVAFDESGEVRALYPVEGGFATGPGAAVPTPVESRVQFQRDAAGRILSMTWTRDGAPPRRARRLATETHEDVRFSNGPVQLAGTLIAPSKAPPRRPAIILVHGSGPETRDYMLPFARFLIRRGMAVLTYDKRGVGGSTGDWKTASFDDLAGDVIAAFEYLKRRRDIDAAQIGLLGISQAGWVMPIAAVRTKDLAFLISVSGAGVTPAETTLDQARNEMTGRGMPPQAVDQIVALMRLQYRFAQSGEGWDEYAAARARIAARMGGAPPDTFPGTPDDLQWQSIRRIYFHDPAPTLRQLRLPTLALFGELDTNIVAEKNRAAWEAALKAGGHPDYTLRIVPKANHIHLEAKTGTNPEMASLQRFVPAYFTTIDEWLTRRIRGFGAR
jgi:uncharacterized protein